MHGQAFAESVKDISWPNRRDVAVRTGVRDQGQVGCATS
jgi:hypothetical protein